MRLLWQVEVSDVLKVKEFYTALADLDFYKFVSEGFRELCDACGIYPCLLDAAIFSSFDN